LPETTIHASVSSSNISATAAAVSAVIPQRHIGYMVASRTAFQVPDEGAG
jgi:hypothetical protein